ncbi:unnamed protein product [Adineta steineri]|uniref:Uncharacterized protein n=1 Tax=Adineta steineri TaxID=433720 RepID=A0A815RB37_9BILA|nr:unnamed protein product [Adineta steineri]CAF3741966.1 unnamed protein product [Adineta steineri]
MSDEHTYNPDHNIPHFIPKKKENIRVFVQRKRSSFQSNSFRKFISTTEKQLNMNKKYFRNNKNTILINYKPIFINSDQQKSIPTYSSIKNNLPSSTVNNTMTTSPPPDSDKINRTLNQQSVSFDVPDTEDPFVFIESMYQQLFTEDGQLRNGTEPAVLADCVKQIVTHSRRNSIVHRDPIFSNVYQRKSSMPSKRTSVSSSIHLIPDIFSEEEEEYDEEQESHITQQTNRLDNTSQRSSKHSIIDHNDHHQQLHAFVNSYYQNQRQTSIDHNRIKSDNHLSVDDTDNEDLDTFSDLNSYRKTIRNSPRLSMNDDTIHTDSRLLSSGYQSLRSNKPNISKIDLKVDQNCCSDSSSTSQTSIISPIRDMVTKYINFIFISKNILIVPLLIFFLRQRSVLTSN